MLTETGLWKCTDLEYFSDYSAVSNSMLTAVAKSPALYHGVYVTKTIKNEPSDAMRRGSAFHKAMEYFNRPNVPYIICPNVDRRTKDGKATYAAAEEVATSENLPLVMRDEADAIEEMVASVATHPVASTLLKHTLHREVGLRWHDPETGILCKAKPDLISACEIGGFRVVVDYKSALDPYPEAFPKSLANFAYHRQAAHYLAGARAVLNQPFAWALVVVGSEPPHETFVYDINPDDLARGERERSRHLARLNWCIDHDVWVHPETAKILTVSLPSWSKEKGDGL